MSDRRPWIVERAVLGTDRIVGSSWPLIEEDGTLVFYVKMPSPGSLRLPLMVAAYAPGSWVAYREATPAEDEGATA